MDEEREDEISIGARPKSSKEPNPLNQARRDARERGGGRQRGRGQRRRGEAHEQGEERQVEEAHQQEAHEQGEERQVEEAQEEPQPQPQEPQRKIPPFNDGSEITKDWTTSDLFDDPIYQHADTCASVVFTRLTQAAYNRDKPIAQRRTLSYRHLADHIRSVTGKKKSFSFRKFSIAKNFIRENGIHRDGVTSGQGGTTKMDFSSKRHVEAREVFEKLETVPLGIILEDYPGLHNVRMEIYNVPGNRDEEREEHALLAVAKGRTADGVDFIVVQNSWGMEYGNNGYCRIFLPDTRDYDIFWPLW